MNNQQQEVHEHCDRCKPTSEKQESHEGVEEILREFRKMFDDNLWRDEKDPTMSLMAIGNVEDWLRSKLTPLVAEKEDCATCTPELYAHKKNGQTVPICKKHYNELLTPQTQPASTGWEESHTQGWVHKLKDITHKRGEGDIRGSCGSPCSQCDKDVEIKAFIKEVAAQEYERGQEDGARGKLFSSIEMTEPLPKHIYDKIFEAGKLQGREVALREAIAVVPKEIVLGRIGEDPGNMLQRMADGIATANRDGFNDCRKATLAALSSLAAPTEITNNDNQQTQ